MPLRRYLRGAHDSVAVYASGINPDQPQELAAARLADGRRVFKLEFGAEREIASLQALRELPGPHTPLIVDAN